MIETKTAGLDALTVPRLIRMHGDATEKLAYWQHKLDLLRTLRAGITDQEDVSELIVATCIGDYEAIVAALSVALGYEEPHDA
jgi:hypothetical protein